MTEVRRQRTEDRRQRTEDRRQKSEDRSQRTDDRGQMTDNRIRKSECGRGKAEFKKHSAGRIAPNQIETGRANEDEIINAEYRRKEFYRFLISYFRIPNSEFTLP